MNEYLGFSRPCENCGAQIGFFKNRNSKVFPVDLFTDSDGSLTYRSNMGNHGNYTPCHKCDTRASGYPHFEDRYEFMNIDIPKMDGILAFYRELNLLDITDIDLPKICKILKCGWMIE